MLTVAAGRIFQGLAQNTQEGVGLQEWINFGTNIRTQYGEQYLIYMLRFLEARVKELRSDQLAMWQPEEEVWDSATSELFKAISCGEDTIALPSKLYDFVQKCQSMGCDTGCSTTLLDPNIWPVSWHPLLTPGSAKLLTAQEFSAKFNELKVNKLG